MFHQVEHVLPARMRAQLHERFTPEEIMERGGVAFSSAWDLMVDVLTSHLMWTLNHIESLHERECLAAEDSAGRTIKNVSNGSSHPNMT